MSTGKLPRADRSGDTRFEHGASGYTNWSCSCAVCRAGNTAHQRKRRGERYTYTALYGLPVEVAHSESAYTNWGCRCEICTAAHTRVRRNRDKQPC